MKNSNNDLSTTEDEKDSKLVMDDEEWDTITATSIIKQTSLKLPLETLRPRFVFCFLVNLLTLFHLSNP
jgi:hypothetical protein